MLTPTAVKRFLVLFAIGAVSTATMPACGSASGDQPSGSGRIPVVAGENFYGDIAAQLGGRYVAVTSILSDPNTDPHLFEPGTATAVQVARARVVIQNGLGYDAFIDRLLAAAPNSSRAVVTISEALGIEGAGANPHLWYDVPRLPEMAGAISDALAAADPVHRASFEGRLRSFDASLDPLRNAVAAIKTRFEGAPVAYTEPVPGYLLAAAGLAVQTPDAFARSIEEGNDPTPQAVAAMESIIDNRQIRVLLYNGQATSPITDRLRELARRRGIPVVAVTETLPPGRSFQTWQLGQAEQLLRALGG